MRIVEGGFDPSRGPGGALVAPTKAGIGPGECQNALWPDAGGRKNLRGATFSELKDLGTNPEMPLHRHQRLEAHLRRHARMLHNIARGFGRHRDADDIIQILYARWWQRSEREPGWSPPEDSAELFVCVKRVVLDEVAKEVRRRTRDQHEAGRARPDALTPEESLHAFQRLQWILQRLPAQLAEVLERSLSAGRSRDAAVAEELGLSHGAYTARLFKARRAAEELAAYYDLLSPEQANLMAELRFSGKTRAQIAHELSILSDDLTQRWQQALEVLEQLGTVRMA